MNYINRFVYIEDDIKSRVSNRVIGGSKVRCFEVDKDEGRRNKRKGKSKRVIKRLDREEEVSGTFL